MSSPVVVVVSYKSSEPEILSEKKLIENTTRFASRTPSVPRSYTYLYKGILIRAEKYAILIRIGILNKVIPLSVKVLLQSKTLPNHKTRTPRYQPWRFEYPCLLGIRFDLSQFFFGHGCHCRGGAVVIECLHRLLDRLVWYWFSACRLSFSGRRSFFMALSIHCHIKE